MIYSEGCLVAQAEKAKLVGNDGNTLKSKKRKQEKDEEDSDGSFVIDDGTEEITYSSPVAKKTENDLQDSFRMDSADR